MSSDRKTRIPWLTGLKGLICLQIFTHHFFLGIYPATFYGSEVPSKTASGIDTVMASHPLGAFINGNFGVCIFLMISAFLFASKIMRDDLSGKRTDLFRLCSRRYFRLMVPFAATTCVYYAVVRTLDRLAMNTSGKTLHLPFKEALKHAVLYQWFFYDTEIDGIFWTMALFLWGAMLAAFFALFDRRERWYMSLVYLAVSVPIVLKDHYYAGVLFGVILADLVCYGRLERLWRRASGRFSGAGSLESGTVGGGSAGVAGLRAAAGACLLLLGIFLGGYPSHAPVEGTVYALVPAPGLLGVIRYDYMHCWGAFFLIAAFFLLPLSLGLNGRVMQHLGDISFSFYLLHMLVLEYFGYWFHMTLEQRTGSPLLAGIATWLACVALILLGAELLHRTAEKWSTVLPEKAAALVEKLIAGR